MSSQRYVSSGAASGIGRHLTGELLARGHRVLATDVDVEALAGAAASWPSGNLLTRGLDVRRPDEWEAVLDQAVEAWGGVDGVFNIAGVLRPGEVRSLGEDDVHFHFDINVKGVVFGTRAAAGRMVEQGSGHIVNIASLASLAPIPGMALYSASKYAVRAFSLAAAEELRPHGVAVTTLCPDAVATPMFDLQLDYREAALTFTAPRVLTPADVTRVVLKALRKRPLLVAFPRRRAFLARLADLFPATQRLIVGQLQKQGLAKQEAMRRQRQNEP